MFIRQISVFVENRAGRVADITECIAAAGVDMRAISVADTSDFGILRIIVDKPDIAVAALKAAGLTVLITNVIGVCISDVAGAFSQAMRVLADADIGVDYVYAFIGGMKGKAYIIIRPDGRPDSTQVAVDALSGAGFELLDETLFKN